MPKSTKKYKKAKKGHLIRTIKDTFGYVLGRKGQKIHIGHKRHVSERVGRKRTKQEKFERK